jgi:hypothetical protein
MLRPRCGPIGLIVGLLLGSAACIGNEGGVVGTPAPPLSATPWAVADGRPGPAPPLRSIEQQAFPVAPTPEPLQAAKDVFAFAWGTIEPGLPHLVYAQPPGASMDRAVDSTALQRSPDEPALPMPVGGVGGSCGGIAPDSSGQYFLYTRVTEGEPLLSGLVRPYSSESERAKLPSIRLLDAESGDDSIFADSGCGPAWSAEGRIAYVQPRDPASQPYEYYLASHLIVHSSREHRAEVWTGEPQAFGGLVWAGDRLLAHRGRPRSDFPLQEDLVVFEAPGAMRTVVRGGKLIALSPDGARALVTTLGDHSGGYQYDALIVRLEDGAVLARKVLPQWELANLAAGGTWDGDRVFATIGRAAAATAPPGPMIVILDVGDGGLEIERVINLLGMETRRLGLYDRIYDARLVSDGERIGFWVSRPTLGGFYGECDLAARGCLLSQNPNGRGFVASSSRPWPGR